MTGLSLCPNFHRRVLLVLDPKNKGRGKVQNSRFVHKSRKIVLGLKPTGWSSNHNFSRLVYQPRNLYFPEACHFEGLDGCTLPMNQYQVIEILFIYLVWGIVECTYDCTKQFQLYVSNFKTSKFISFNVQQIQFTWPLFVLSIELVASGYCINIENTIPRASFF